MVSDSEPDNPASDSEPDGPASDSEPDGPASDSEPDGPASGGAVERVVRVGVVGAGYIARAHLGAYAARSDVAVVGIADPVAAKAEALAGAVGATAVADLDGLLALGVDAISVCTPSPTHADVAVAALAAGVHVLCEKPIARTLADAERIVAAGDASTATLMIGHVSRFEPDHARARQLVEQGAIGELRSMTQSIRSARPTWSQGDWLGDADASGGPLVDLAIHSFDYLGWICGRPPTRVSCVAAGGSPDLATFTLTTVRYEGGAMALVESSWAHPDTFGLQLETEIVGTTGRISWDYDSIRGGTITTAGSAPAPIDVLGSRGFRAEIDAFVEAILAGAPPPISARDAVVALRTALAAAESAATGRTITLADGAEGAER